MNARAPRTTLLAVFAFTALLGLAALLAAALPACWNASRSTYRLYVFLILPSGLVLVAAPWAVAARRQGASKPPPSRRALRVAVLFAALALAPSGVFAAYGLGWSYFSYADHALAVRMPKVVLWTVPAALALGVGWEWALRVGFVGAWRRAGCPAAGWYGAACLSLLLGWSQVAEGTRVLSAEFAAAGLFRLACLEAACTSLCAWGPGFFWAGIYRGLQLFVAVWVVNDWYSPLYPAANYVSSGAAAQALHAAGPLFAALALIALAHRERKHDTTPTIA